MLRVPLRELLDPAHFREEVWSIFGMSRAMWFFDLEDDTVWGATASMLVQLLGFATGTVAVAARAASRASRSTRPIGARAAVACARARPPEARLEIVVSQAGRLLVATPLIAIRPSSARWSCCWRTGRRGRSAWSRTAEPDPRRGGGPGLAAGRSGPGVVFVGGPVGRDALVGLGRCATPDADGSGPHRGRLRAG